MREMAQLGLPTGKFIAGIAIAILVASAVSIGASTLISMYVIKGVEAPQGEQGSQGPQGEQGLYLPDYDSGWVDITDKTGQYFSITHNLNYADVLVDIAGRTEPSGSVHQRYLGLTGFTTGWSQTHGGTRTDFGYALVQTVDGGYTIAGYTYSFGAGSSDVYLVKTDASGNMLWNKTYGGTSIEYGFSLVQTVDGGYAIAGLTRSFGAGGDVYLVKTNTSGAMLWNKTYGGTRTDYGWSIVQTVDGGYTIAGDTGTFGAGINDVYLVKTEVELGLARTGQTANTVTLYRGATDPYWNYVRVRIWKID